MLSRIPLRDPVNVSKFSIKTDRIELQDVEANSVYEAAVKFSLVEEIEAKQKFEILEGGRRHVFEVDCNQNPPSKQL